MSIVDGVAGISFARRRENLEWAIQIKDDRETAKRLLLRAMLEGQTLATVLTSVGPRHADLEHHRDK